jgi:hypothetical protein
VLYFRPISVYPPSRKEFAGSGSTGVTRHAIIADGITASIGHRKSTTPPVAVHRNATCGTGLWQKEQSALPTVVDPIF